MSLVGYRLMTEKACYNCIYGRPYYPVQESNINQKNYQLSICKINKQGKHTIAAVKNPECMYWREK